MRRLDFSGGRPESETKTLVVFTDCHASHNVEIRVNDYYEGVFRNFCMRYSYPFCIRSRKTEERNARLKEQRLQREAAISRIARDRQTVASYELCARGMAWKGGAA